MAKESVVARESSVNPINAMRNLVEMRVNQPGRMTDAQREEVRSAGYTFDSVSGPGVSVTDIYQNGRRVGKTINGKTKWY